MPIGATLLTPEERQGLKDNDITTFAELNELESENITEGQEWLSQQPKSFDELTDEAARQIHKRLRGGPRNLDQLIRWIPR